MIVDAHLDLAFNALNHGRDLLLPLAELRHIEARQPRPGGTATVTIPALQAADVGLVFGTLFVAPPTASQSMAQVMYHTPADAHRLAQAQLDYYHRLFDARVGVQMVRTADELSALADAPSSPLGVVLLMEGADPIREPAEFEMWHARGVRVVGLAWDDTRYAAGSLRGKGGITAEGYALMEVMASMRTILDISHMSEQATFEIFERYEHAICATHCNARALAPHCEQRLLSDTQIRLLAERGGVMGVVLYNPFLRWQHKAGDPRHRVTVAHVVAHIDHVCQLLGSADHIGIGSDFDGGFGWEDTPPGVDSHAGFQTLAAALRERGYTETHIANILGGNWVRFLQQAL